MCFTLNTQLYIPKYAKKINALKINKEFDFNRIFIFLNTFTYREYFRKKKETKCNKRKY